MDIEAEQLFRKEEGLALSSMIDVDQGFHARPTKTLIEEVGVSKARHSPLVAFPDMQFNSWRVEV